MMQSRVLVIFSLLIPAVASFHSAGVSHHRIFDTSLHHRPHVAGTPMNERPPPILGRRGLLKTGMITSTIGSVLLQVAGIAKAEDEQSSWMASTDQVKQLRALDVLQKEANRAASLVTPEIRRDYHQNGVAVVRGAVSMDWIDTLRAGCEDAQDEPGPYAEYLQKPTDEGLFFTDLELARRLPVFSAFCQHGPCAAVAGAVMGSTSVRYLYDQLFLKDKGVTTYTPWHQDGGYWRIKGPQIGSVFVPLDPVEPSDCLAFVQGSQRWELHNPQHFADGTPYRGSSLPTMPNIGEMIDKQQVYLQSFRLSPGDVLVFSSSTVHGGPGNWGRALSTRWTGDDAKFWARPGEGAVPTGDVCLEDGELLAHNPAAFPECWSDTTTNA